ncbi:MAG: hypothetical protein A3F68_06960 [Acidobacteria bacterium RIFCSPLOWO2_12_FULL_54_10]|nr:MAG: hypothetical protein A3F68_06960 [Acidobacteria bacterium RIFCSPLOWO2_12_FULL_54_10]
MIAVLYLYRGMFQPSQDYAMQNPDSRSISGNQYRPSKASRNRLMFPREHGAWGMVSLPFLAGMFVAGNWMNLRTLAAALVIYAVFLLREPLLYFWRAHSAKSKFGSTNPAVAISSEEHNLRNSALISLIAYGLIAAVSGANLLTVLNLAPLFLIALGASVLMLVALYFTVHNRQRNPFLQIAVALGLTSSSLLAYLAGKGQWDESAYWIWLLSAANSGVSITVVHARLETLLAFRKPELATVASRRNAWIAQASLYVLLLGLLLIGKPWLTIPFVPPVLLHSWELWCLRSGPQKLSMHQVGWMQLGGSVSFCLLLILVLRN